MTEKKYQQVCNCENCGNEAEMEITCQWIEVEKAEEKKKTLKAPQKVKGTGTCTNCGNEAEAWVDL